MKYGDVHLNSVSTYSQNEKPNGVKKWSLQVQTQKPSFQFLLKTVTEEFIALSLCSQVGQVDKQYGNTILLPYHFPLQGGIEIER